jgi:hypothetical protein
MAASALTRVRAAASLALPEPGDVLDQSRRPGAGAGEGRA